MGIAKGLVVGTLIMSLLFLAASTLLLYVGNTNSVTVDSDYANLFNNYNETLMIYGTSQEIIDSGQLNPAGYDQGLFKNVIVANKQIGQSSSLFTRFIGQVGQIIPMPYAIITMIITLVFILLMFAFITTISKKEP